MKKPWLLCVVWMAIGMGACDRRADLPSETIELKALNDEVAQLYLQGQYDKALAVARKTLDLAETTFGPSHPEVAAALNNLAGLYDAQGQHALAIREKTLGPDHPRIAATLENMALFYAKTGNTSEETACKKRAAQIHAQSRSAP